MIDTHNTPTLRHSVEFQLQGVPAMLKFEIPGFEGWKPAEGQCTDHIRKILTYQDAIVLIMDAMNKLKQSLNYKKRKSKSRHYSNRLIA